MTNWRVRSVITSFAILPETFSIRGHGVRTREIRKTINQASVSLLDIEIHHEKVEDAMMIGIDLSNDIADRVSFLSNAEVNLKMISATLPGLSVGESTEICLLQGSFKMSCVELSQDTIELFDQFNIESKEVTALNEFRNGISAHNPFDKFKGLWNSVEVIADTTAKKEGLRQEILCSECGHVVHRPYKVHEVMKGQFQLVHGEESESIADEMRKFRGELNHGSLANEELRLATEQHIAKLEPVALSSLSQTLDIKSMRKRTICLGTPLMVLKIERTGEGSQDFKLEPMSYQVRAAFPEVPDEFVEDTDSQIFFGTDFPIPIDQLALPD